MTGQEFMAWAADQLDQYNADPAFKIRVASVLERQANGKKLLLPEIADALQMPLWLAELSMAQAEATMAHVIIPETEAGAN